MRFLCVWWVYLCQDHERAYFDSADWALGKVLMFQTLISWVLSIVFFPLSWCYDYCLGKQQGVAKPKGPLEALRPKLQVSVLEHTFQSFLRVISNLRYCPHPTSAANAAADALQEVSMCSIRRRWRYLFHLIMSTIFKAI